MKTRIKISERADKILLKIKTNYHLTPNIICRYAIALSLLINDELSHNYDNSGREFQRQTLTGDDDLLIKELIKNYHRKHITDDEYMSIYLKGHIERGLIMLDRNIQLHGSFDNYIDEQFRSGGTI